MSSKLYANDRCIAEIFSPNEFQETTGHDSIKCKKEKKICNCPNCGAPINSYICEYCGTEFEKPEKKPSDEEMRESFAEFAKKQRQAELQAVQEFQTQWLLNTLNRYNANTQIMNIQDSIQASIMSCQLSNFQTQIDQANHNIYQHIPNTETIDKEEPGISISKADDELASAMTIFMIGMVLFTIFAIVVTVIYNLF